MTNRFVGDCDQRDGLVESGVGELQMPLVHAEAPARSSGLEISALAVATCWLYRFSIAGHRGIRAWANIAKRSLAGIEPKGHHFHAIVFSKVCQSFGAMEPQTDRLCRLFMMPGAWLWSHRSSRLWPSASQLGA